MRCTIYSTVPSSVPLCEVYRPTLYQLCEPSLVLNRPSASATPCNALKRFCVQTIKRCTTDVNYTKNKHQTNSLSICPLLLLLNKHTLTHTHTHPHTHTDPPTPPHTHIYTIIHTFQYIPPNPSSPATHIHTLSTH